MSGHSEDILIPEGFSENSNWSSNHVPNFEQWKESIFFYMAAYNVESTDQGIKRGFQFKFDMNSKLFDVEWPN